MPRNVEIKARVPNVEGVRRRGAYVDLLAPAQKPAPDFRR